MMQENQMPSTVSSQAGAGQLKDAQTSSAQPSPAPPTGVVILPANSAHIPEANAAK